MLFGFAWAAWGLERAVVVFLVGLAMALATTMIVLGKSGAQASADAT
jgi:hypothetical protein